MTQILTQSRLATFRACPRKHQIRYEMGIRPEDKGYAAKVGSAFHAAIDAIAKGDDVEAVMAEQLDDAHDLAMVAAMVQAYSWRWQNYELEVVASELPFELPLRNPATGASTPVWNRAGVIDRIVRLPSGQLAIKESKTTSLDFTPGANYWLRLHMDQQLSMYVLAARELGYEIDTILYDVTRRPSLRPYRATPEDKRKYKKDGTLYANQREEDETPEDFAARVAADMVERHEHYFARIEIARLDRDLDECAAEVWLQQQAIRRHQLMGRWYRNPGACFAPYPCAYLPICQNRDLDRVTPAGFVRVEDVHPELAAHGASRACHVPGLAGQEEE